MAPKGTNGDGSPMVTPSAQEATNTVPSQIGNESIAEDQNDSETTKIVKASPGV